VRHDVDSRARGGDFAVTLLRTIVKVFRRKKRKKHDASIYPMF